MKFSSLTIIILLSFIVTGCALNQPDQPTQVSDDGVQEQTSSPALAPSQGVTDDDIDTSDWKVYENEELGVRFRYPEDFSLEFNDHQNKFAVAIGFSLEEGRGVFISVTNLEKRKKTLTHSDYNVSRDNIQFDVEKANKDFWSEVLEQNPDTIVCDRSFQKKIGDYNYHLVLSCDTYEGLYTRLGYTLFQSGYYVSAWIDVDDFLMEDGFISTTTINQPLGIKQVLPNPEKGIKTGKAMAKVESILARIQFAP